MIDHDLITVPMGMHPPLGFSSVRGTGATGSAAAILEADRADAMVWLAPGGSWAGGQTAFVVDSSAWTALGILATRIGSALAPSVLEVNVPDNQSNAVLVQDATGLDYVRLQNTNGGEQLVIGNTTTDPNVVVLTDGYLALQNTTRDARMQLSGNALVLNTETDVAPQVTQLTTGQRDALTPTNGMLLYNTSLNELHARINGAWVALGAGGGGGGTLDAAYDFGGAGAGRTIVVDSGSVRLQYPDAADTHYALEIAFQAAAFTGTPHGILIDWTAATSLSNAGDVYGINLIGETNAGAGNSVAIRVDGGWDRSAEFAGDLVFTDASSEIYTVGSNAFVRLRGNRSAGDASSDVVIGSQLTRTAGSILVVNNNATNVALIGFDGTLRLNANAIINQDAVAGTINNPFLALYDGDGGTELVYSFLQTNRGASYDGTVQVYSALSSATANRSDRTTMLIVGGGVDGSPFNATGNDVDAVVWLQGHEATRPIDAIWAGGLILDASAHELLLDAPTEGGIGGAGTDGYLRLNGQKRFTGTVSPAQITANQNDYNPTNLARAWELRINSDAIRIITGLAGGADGRILHLTNVGSFPITLAHEDTGSTAANRFDLATATDADLKPRATMVLKYDAASSRWRTIPQDSRRRAVKSSDQSFSVATLANVTGLAFAVKSGRYYKFKFDLIFQSDTATVGLGLGLTFPAVTRFAATQRSIAAAVASNAEVQGGLSQTSGTKSSGTAVEAINTDYMAHVEGIIIPSADGTLQLQAATEVGTTTVIVRQGSMGEIEEVSP